MLNIFPILQYNCLVKVMEWLSELSKDFKILD